MKSTLVPMCSAVSRTTVDHRKGPFAIFARWVSMEAGRPGVFLLACAVILVWLVTGPLFGFSNTWQLVINTTTTIVTFLMVFLIQNTQNRDSIAMQIKLDELIRSDADAHNALLDLEELTDAELEQMRHKYEDLAAKAREALRRGQSDTKIVEV